MTNVEEAGIISYVESPVRRHVFRTDKGSDAVVYEALTEKWQKKIHTNKEGSRCAASLLFVLRLVVS